MGWGMLDSFYIYEAIRSSVFLVLMSTKSALHNSECLFYCFRDSNLSLGLEIFVIARNKITPKMGQLGKLAWLSVFYK